MNVPGGYKIATWEQRTNNPYPEDCYVQYAYGEGWIAGAGRGSWADERESVFAVPESYQFPNDKPTESEPTVKAYTINLKQRVKLFDWCREHKDDERTFDDLYIQATADLRFAVSLAVLKNHWAAVNGPRKVKVTGGTLIGRIAELEAQVNDLELRVTKNANTMMIRSIT